MSRRLAELHITGEMLLDLLREKFPEWGGLKAATFHHAAIDESKGTILLRLTSPDLPELHEGATYPRLFFINSDVLRLPPEAVRINL